MLGCYRTGDANDPEVYITGVLAVLSCYDLDVVDQVVHPMSGLPGRVKWLPTIAEVKSACEEIQGPWRRAQEWHERTRLQLAERKQQESLPPPKQSYEDFKAEMAARGLPVDWKSRDKIAADDVRLRFGLSPEQWALIPDLPWNHEDKSAEWQDRNRR